VSSNRLSASLATGIRLPYVERGDASGVPMLLLHGYADSSRFFEPLLAHLPDWVHAYVPDQRGHGDADRPAHGYAPEDYAADAAAFMDAVGLDGAIVVGQSSGGYTAQRFAIDHPRRTLGLVLIGTPRDFRDRRAAEAFWHEISRLEDPIDAGWVRAFVESFPVQPVPPALVDTMVAESCKLPARVWKAAFRGLLDAEVPIETGAITAPTLIVWGERDDLCPRSGQEALAAAIPGAELVTYAGTGHAVACELPARTAADLADFARRLS
jgi:rifampin ADP-ribosylating transferase